MDCGAAPLAARRMSEGRNRVILYHKQATSARTRFLKYAYNSVCAFESIPIPAQQLEGDQPPNMLKHSAAILQQGEYGHNVEVSGKTIQILLACITTIDLPFEEAERANAEFIDS